MSDKSFVNHIVVRDGAVQSAESYDLVQANISFFNYLTRDGALRRDDFPRECVQSYHVDYYLAQVNNGGHEQFVANSRWQRLINDDIELGLAAMGAQKCLALFKQFRAYVDRDASELAAMKARGGFKHPTYGDPNPALGDFDKAFYALNRSEEDLIKLNSNFLRSLTDLKRVPDADWKGVLDQIIADNPRRSERLAELEEQRKAAMVAHERRLLLLGVLCEKVGLKREPSRAMTIYNYSHEGQSYEAYVVRTDMGQVALVELADEALLVAFPDATRLAEGKISDLLNA